MSAEALLNLHKDKRGGPGTVNVEPIAARARMLQRVDGPEDEDQAGRRRTGTGRRNVPPGFRTAALWARARFQGGTACVELFTFFFWPLEQNLKRFFRICDFGNFGANRRTVSSSHKRRLCTAVVLSRVVNFHGPGPRPAGIKTWTRRASIGGWRISSHHSMEAERSPIG